MQEVLRVGSVVVSTKGRDKDTYLMVYEVIAEDRILVVDGDKRPLNNKKVKNVKHVKATGFVLEKIAEKIKNNKAIFDKEIAKALREVLEKRLKKEV